MKILICVSEFPPYSGGIGYMVSELQKVLKNTGVQVDVCSPYGPDIKIGNPLLIRKYGRIGLLKFWKECLKYIQNEQKEYDIIWLHNPFFAPDSFKAPLPLPLVSTIHITLKGQLQRRFSFTKKAYKSIFQHIEKQTFIKLYLYSNMTAISHQVRHEIYSSILEDTFNAHRKPIRIIPNGVDTSMFHPPRSKKEKRKIKEEIFGVDSNNTVILFVGRLVDVKNPKILIDIFREIKKTMDISLVFAGDGPLKEILEKKAIKVDRRNIVFLGQVPHKHIPRIYQGGDYFILPSTYEGLPLVILEAMASGLPPIYSDIENLYFIKYSNCGKPVNFNTGSISQISQEIIKYLENTHYKYESVNSRRFIEINYDLRKIGAQYVQYFKEMIS